VLENWRSMENSMCWEKSKIYGAYGHDIHDSSWFTKKKNIETGECRWIDSLLRQHSPLRGPIQGHSKNGPVEMTYVCVYTLVICLDCMFYQLIALLSWNCSVCAMHINSMHREREKQYIYKYLFGVCIVIKSSKHIKTISDDLIIWMHFWWIKSI
jgi:hypothetical protein